jgi:CRP-like cAMP-binding protein
MPVLNLVSLFGNESRKLQVLAGEAVFNVGDPASDMYVVIEGQIDICSGDTLYETVEAGGLFGEMALVDSSPRSASAVARVDSTLVPIDERRFIFLIQNTPYFALHVMTVIAQRLRRKT